MSLSVLRKGQSRNRTFILHELGAIIGSKVCKITPNEVHVTVFVHELYI